MVKQKTFINILLPLLGVSTSLSAGALLLTWLLYLLLGNIVYYFFSLLAVVLSIWYGEKKTGLLTTIFTTGGLYIIFYSTYFPLSLHQFPPVFNLFLYFLTGLLVTIVIEKIQNTPDIQLYKAQEKEYLAQIDKLKQENANYQKEVLARDEFLSMASHELKTPLSAMLLQIQTALHNIRNVSLANFSVEKLLKMLQSTEQQSKRLSKMINDLLNVSLIRTGRLELEKESLNLSQVVGDVVERFSEKAEREGSPIKTHLEKDVIGEFDKLRIEQAVINLISNAIKYGDGEKINVGVTKENGIGKIIVADHGIGIPEDRQGRIFERFERAVSNHNYKGLGVGLYITQHIVATHQGRITLRSKPDEGSTFTIELPLRIPVVQTVSA